MTITNERPKKVVNIPLFQTIDGQHVPNNDSLWLPDVLAAEHRIMSKVVKERGGCWLWTAGRDDRGWGRIHVAGRWRDAHRAVWMLHNLVPIPVGYDLDHECEVRHCVRPDHLQLLTHAEHSRLTARRRRERRQQARQHAASRARMRAGATPADAVRAAVGLLATAERQEAAAGSALHPQGWLDAAAANRAAAAELLDGVPAHVAAAAALEGM